MIIANFRNIQCVQGAADAFVQASEPTGIDPSSGKAWLLKRLEISIPASVGLQAISADADIHFALSRDSKAAMADLNDADIICVLGLVNSLTTTGQVVFSNKWVYTFPEGVIAVEPTLYAQMDSAATGLVLTGNFRLYYEVVKLAEVDILRMLAQG